MDKVDAIVLAGAPAGPELDPDGLLQSRAMINLCGKTMLQRVVDALKGSSCVGRVVAVGNVAADGIDRVIPPGSDLITNVKLGLDALDARGAVLVVSSDVPLLTSEAVDDFVSRASALEVDLAYPILPREVCERRYPDLRRTYLKTSDGEFTGGNLMLVRPEFIQSNWGLIQKAYAARKRVLKLARMIGVGVLVRTLLGQVIPAILKVSYLENAVSRLVGARVAAVVSNYVEIGEDVDKPSDVEAVRRILERSACKVPS